MWCSDVSFVIIIIQSIVDNTKKIFQTYTTFDIGECTKYQRTVDQNGCRLCNGSHVVWIFQSQIHWQWWRLVMELTVCNGGQQWRRHICRKIRAMANGGFWYWWYNKKSTLWYITKAYSQSVSFYFNLFWMFLCFVLCKVQFAYVNQIDTLLNAMHFCILFCCDLL